MEGRRTTSLSRGNIYTRVFGTQMHRYKNTTRKSLAEEAVSFLLFCEKLNAKQIRGKTRKGVLLGMGERLGARETQTWRDDTIFCSSRRFQLMTVCKQNVNAKDASKYIKGRERRINMFCCHFQERNGVPSSLLQ